MHWLPVDPRLDDGWDERVAAWPEASFFHSQAWFRILGQVYGYEPCAVVRGAEDGRTACLPLMDVRSPVTGRRGVGLPFTDACPPLVGSPGELCAAMDAARAMARERKWRYVEVRGARETPADWAPPFLAYVTHNLSLDRSEDELFAALDSNARRSVRRAQREGLTAAPGESLDDMRAFYRLQCATRRQHGLPPQPFRFFHALHEHVVAAGHGFLLLVRAPHGARPVAGALFFGFGRELTFKFGASDETALAARPNHLAMWEGIRAGLQRGLTRLCFGKTRTDNEGLRRFKSSWGAGESPLLYHRLDMAAGRFVRGDDHVTGWHNALFRLLPTSLSRVLGALLYVHAA